MKATKFLSCAALFMAAGLLFSSCYHRDDYNSYPNNNNNNNNNNGNANNNSPRGNTTQVDTVVYDEEFNGSDHQGWSFTDATDSAYTSITGGSYQYVDYSAVKSNFVTVNTGVSTSGNFKVTTRIKSNKIMGLVFGASSSDNGYAFYVDRIRRRNRA